MRNVSDQSFRENKKCTFLCSITFSPENRAVYDITWKRVEKMVELTGQISI
jgi:hypothetical protein